MKNGVDISEGGDFYGTIENELASESRLEESAIDYAFLNNTPCISVYRGEKFEMGYKHHYHLKDGSSYKDALLIVFVLKNY
jgi:hypothetical protein